MKGNITVVNKHTGEVWDFGWANDEGLAEAYANINETLAALERGRRKLREAVLKQMEKEGVDHRGVGRYIWHKRINRYLNYDLSTMRKVLDEDTLNLLIKPDKPKIDQMLKDSANNPKSPVIEPKAASALRETMVEERAPAVVLRLEVKNDG